MTLLGTKLGMSTLYTKRGATPVTLIEAGPCVVTQVKTDTKDGYAAIQLGYGQARKLTRPMQAHLKPAGARSYKLGEFRCDDPSAFEVGQNLTVEVFKTGDIIKVSGVSKGRGFSGGVRRHGFAGGPKTHGQSDRWRAPGSIGAGSTPGRVLRGTRMAGQFGNKKVSTLGIEVVEVMPKRNLVFVKGAVPGPTGGLIRLEKQR